MGGTCQGEWAGGRSNLGTWVTLAGNPAGLRVWCPGAMDPDVSMVSNACAQKDTGEHTMLRTCRTALVATLAIASALIVGGCCCTDGVSDSAGDSVIYSSGYSEGDLLGRYRMQDGPECSFELELLPDGCCDCWSNNICLGSTRTKFSATWSIVGSTVAIDLDGATIAFGVPDGRWGMEATPLVDWRDFVGVAPLVIKPWGGHVYLVRPDDIRIFDEFGPTTEFCFSLEGARGLRAGRSGKSQ